MRPFSSVMLSPARAPLSPAASSRSEACEPVDAQANPTLTPVACAAPPRTASAGVGSMLRRCREARGLSIRDVARGTNLSGAPLDHAIVKQAASRIADVEEGLISGSWIGVVLDVLHAAEPMSSQERDTLLCAAGVVPPDLVAALLAHPERLDAVRALLTEGT